MLLFAITHPAAKNQEVDQSEVVPPSGYTGIYVASTLKALRPEDFAVRTIYRKTGKLDKVQVTFESKTSSPEAINYRFIWLEENGRDIPVPGAQWETLTVRPGVFTSLRGVAPVNRAANYRLEIVPAKTEVIPD